MKYLNIKIGWHYFSILPPQDDFQLFERIKNLLPFKTSNKNNLYLIKIIIKKPGEIKAIKISDTVSLQITKKNAYLFLTNRQDFPAIYRALFIYSIFVHLKNNTLILHSAGININGSGYIFSGRSGSGKTTIAKKFSHKYVLSDEAVAIKSLRGNIWMAGTPFGTISSREKHQLKVNSLFFITKSKKVQIKKIAYPGSLPLFLNHIPFFEELDTKNRKKAFKISAKLCKKIKIYSLQVPRKAKIKKIVTRCQS